jgi:hypothetical protein
MDWARVLAYITGTVDQELLLRNEYLATENRILFGESSLRHTLREYLAHYNAERNHQGRGNVLLFPSPATNSNRCNNPTIHNRERLGGLLKYYHSEAA